MNEDSVDAKGDVISLRFSRKNEKDQDVPLAVLGKVAEALQLVIYLLAYQHEGIDLPRHARISRNVEEDYTLVCEALEPGSVIVPTHFAPSNNPQANRLEVTSLFAAVSDAVTENKPQDLSKRVPDPNIRRRLLDALQDMVPPKNSGIYVSIAGPSNLHLTLSESTRRHAAELRRAALKTSEPINQRTITGRLTRINFAERKLTLQYPVTSREL